MSESQAPEATGARRWVVPAVLVACTSTSILSTDLYTPSLPHLPRLLSSDPETVQLTMSLNLAAFAVAQLFHGPLADRYGRRRMLILGLFGFALASIGCALAQGIGGLLAARIAQGICISVPSVLVAVIVRELYSAQMAMRIMGVYGMAVGVAPAIGPLIGGYVYVYAGWRMNFVLLAVLAGVVLVLVARLLPETGGGAGAALGPRRIVADYLRLLGRPAYVRYLVPLVMLFGSLFAFVTAGPFVLIDRMGVATQHYGLYYAVLVVAYIVGGLCVIRLAGRVDPEHLVRSAIFLACLAAVLLAAPTTAPRRLALLGERSRGFLYYVSLTGGTSARARLASGGSSSNRSG